MRRFFFDTTVSSDKLHLAPLASYRTGDIIALPEAVIHHWCRVLRANIGDHALLFDGFGGEYLVELVDASKKQATVRLLDFNAEDRSSSLATTIGLVMSRGDRMDYAIQKATELGVTAIQLLTSQHGEVNLKANQLPKKLAHWQQVAIAACEQCGLNRPPLILAPKSVEQFIQTRLSQEAIELNLAVDEAVSPLLTEPYYLAIQQPADIRLVLTVPEQSLDTTPHQLIALLKQPQSRIDLLIGPEGGLSHDERALALSSGFCAWQIGPRVLRTETAPIVALASLIALHQYLSQSIINNENP